MSRASKDSAATIMSVAEKAGVSKKTVSRVINNEPNVTDKTRQRVLSVMKELHYTPSFSARALASRRTHLLALVYKNPDSDYVVGLQSGMLDACHKYDYWLLTCPLENFEEGSLFEALEKLGDKSRVDGLILAPPISDMPEVNDYIAKLDVPCVRISSVEIERDRSSLYSDDELACEKMTEHLITLGHRKIAFICGPEDHACTELRYQGYCTALKKAGIDLTPSHVALGDFHFESGYYSAQKLLTSANPPTAIFAANDEMAAGVMRYAKEQGIDVPTSLSVAGYDDAPISRQLWPALTTIRQPVREMGEAAASKMLRRVLGERNLDINSSFNCELIFRESTAQAPQ